MIPDNEIREYCENLIARGIVKKKEESRACLILNALCNFFIFWDKDMFMRRAMVLGKTIYMPRSWDFHTTDLRLTYVYFRHEFDHVRFFEKYGVVPGLVAYFLCPLPFLFAYCRYRIERSAILEELKAIRKIEGDVSGRIDYYVDALSGSDYGFAWPFKKSIRKWLVTNFIEKK